MSKSPAPTKMAQRRAEARENILRHATLLFGQFGYDGVALRDVAKAAQIPLATMNSHFARKEDLREAVFDRAIRFIVARNLDIGADDGGEPREELRKFIENIVDLWMSDIPEMKLMDQEYHRFDNPETITMAVRTLEQPLVVNWNAHIATLIKRTGSDILDVMSAERLMQILFAMTYGIIKLSRGHKYMVGAQEVSKQAMVAQITCIFERALGLPSIAAEHKPPLRPRRSTSTPNQRRRT